MRFIYRRNNRSVAVINKTNYTEMIYMNDWKYYEVYRYCYPEFHYKTDKMHITNFPMIRITAILNRY